MTERFTTDVMGVLIDTETKQIYANLDEVAITLNDFHKEYSKLEKENNRLTDKNQQLTLLLNDDQYYKKMVKYRKMYVDVCDDLAESEEYCGELEEKYDKLKKENEKFEEQMNKIEKSNRKLLTFKRMIMTSLAEYSRGELDD